MQKYKCGKFKQLDSGKNIRDTQRIYRIYLWPGHRF